MEAEIRLVKEIKLIKLLEYFKAENRVDVTDKNYESAINLEKMINIYNSDSDILNKYYQMKKIFRYSKEFINEYKYLKEYASDSTIQYLYMYYVEITEFLLKIENNISKDRLKELVELEKDNCYEDYPFARYYVKEYIDYKDSPYLIDFLIEKGLYEQDFNRFLTILVRLDDELYDEYQAKERERKLARQLDVIRKMETIRSGVTTGVTPSGKKFDKVRFYSNLPFYNQETSKSIINDFGFKNLPTVSQRFRVLFENLCWSDANEIMKYVYTNRLIEDNPRLIREEDAKNIRYIVNKKELSSEDVEKILNYMKSKNIPLLHKAFEACKTKYTKEGLPPRKLVLTPKKLRIKPKEEADE